MGQRISGQHQGRRILFSAKEGRRHDRTHDQRNAEIAHQAIENGLIELGDPNLRGRITELKRIRDAARADVERAEARDSNGAEITPEAIAQFTSLARQGLRRDEGTFRRSHIQSLVQRAEVGVDQIMIRGSALKLLQTLTEGLEESLVETAVHDVRSFVPNWLPEQDSNTARRGLE